MIQPAKFFALLAASFVLLINPRPAFACPFEHRQDITNIRDADVVIVGVLSNYEVVEEKYGLLNFRVERAIKGKSEAAVKAIWENSTFALPDEKWVGLGERRIVALRSMESGFLSPALQEAFDGTQPIQVFQRPCEPAFIFPYHQTSESNIRAILKGHDPGAFGYQDPERWIEWRQTERTNLIRRYSPFALALVLALIAAVVFFRRLKRNSTTP